MMKSAKILAWVAIVVTTTMLAYASDPSPLQDFCVAANDPNNTVFVNGFTCKNPMDVTSDDFFYRGINDPLTNTIRTANFTPLTPLNLPGLNTLGISVVWVDYQPLVGMIPPHMHARSSEVIIVLEGNLYVGFVSSSNKLYSTVLHPGDAFVYPQGLMHFNFNNDTTKAVALCAFGTQNYGLLPHYYITRLMKRSITASKGKNTVAKDLMKRFLTASFARVALGFMKRFLIAIATV